MAAGGLLGDVFLHTLPHSLSHDANSEMVGLAVLAGFVMFLLFDILVRSSHGDCHGHDHDHGHNDKDSAPGVKGAPKKRSIFSSAVVLNLVGDSLHNFTDGIAIGASFAGSSSVDDSLPLIQQIQTLLKSRGGLASLAVLFHEIPHELGDYSILVSAGMTKNEAIFAQFSTAIAAYCGTFVGLFGMQTVKDFIGNDLMVPFTAGGFVYLAAVTILPDLLEQRVGRRARLAQVFAFLVGIAFMYGVAILEHAGGSCSHGHGHVHGHGHHGNDHHHHGHGVDLGHHDHHRPHVHEVDSHHHVHLHEETQDNHHHHHDEHDDHHSHDHAHEEKDHHHHHHDDEDDHHQHHDDEHDDHHSHDYAHEENDHHHHHDDEDDQHSHEQEDHHGHGHHNHQDEL